MPCRTPPFIVHQSMLDFDASVQLPWHVSDYSIDKLIRPLVTGQEIIGLIDTGVSQTHVQSGELLGQVIHAADFTNSQYGPYDANGHGSWCAGAMVAKSFGIAKNCAKVVSAKALGDDGSGSDQSIVAAIKWCVDAGAKLLNLSLGSEFPSPSINGILKEMAQQGVFAVCAAGNSSGPVEQPAANPFVLADSAITRERTLANFSCYGAEVDVCGPGVQMTSLSRGGGYAVLSGTSMSSPWITAILACKRAYDVQKGVSPPNSIDQWTAWLTTICDDLGVAGRDAKFGMGVPNAAKFAAVTPPPVVQPPASPPTPAVPKDSIGIAVTTDGTNWFRVPPGTKLVPLKVAA